MELDDEIIQVYVEEAGEHLDGIEDVLLQIEAGGDNPDLELVNRVFRGIHSIKGGAGFFGLSAITDLGHSMENVLNRMRGSELKPNPDNISVLLRAADMLQRMFADIATSNDCDISTLVEELDAINAGPQGAPTTAGGVDGGTPAGDEAAPAMPATAQSIIDEFDDAFFDADKEYEAQPAPSPVQAASTPSAEPAPAPPAPLPAVEPQRTAASPGGDAGRKVPVAESKLRVSVKLLDQLMTLAGELVLTRNQMSLALSSEDTAQMQQAAQRLDQITSEMQETIVSTRMQPVGVVFSKFRRIVRDMARQLGKDIDLSIEGEEVELDKTIIEGLSDPLTHLVRNGVDHGIETPAERGAAGKAEQASLALRAFHEAGQVIIEVADDGRGIDPEKVKAKALEKRLRDAASLEAMGDAELVKLIFLPGFSTATQLTDISGRGVGMDVVNTNLTQMGGVVDIKSSVGAGTTIRIKLPLTLAIIPSLIISLSGKRYAIPQVNVQELVRIPTRDVPQRIQTIGHSQIMRLRGELLPIVRLSEILQLEPVYRDKETGELRRDRRQKLHDRRGTADVAEAPEPCQRDSGDRRYRFESGVNVVVVLAGSLRYGLVVDQLLDSEEIVVKPLDSHFQAQQIYAGATIQGDGGVAMILDVVELSRFVELDASRVDGRDGGHTRFAQSEGEGGTDRHSLLLVKSGERESFAIPLALITRIEKVDRAHIESSGKRRSMIYRQGSLVLFTIDDAADVNPLVEAEEVYVVVFEVQRREVGLLVSAIEDTVNIAIEFDRETFRQPGIFGSAIINDRTTFLVDLLGIVEAVEPGWTRRQDSGQMAAHAQKHILVVEDSRFFIDHLKSFLEESGFIVSTAEDGSEGLRHLEQQLDAIDLVMTDIEMPVMDGFELTRQIRADARLRHLPVVAVTSLAGDVDRARGYEAGVNEYLIKLDKEEILDCLDRYLGQEAGVAQET